MLRKIPDTEKQRKRKSAGQKEEKWGFQEGPAH